MTWPRANRLGTHRLVLEPLQPEHADEMVTALAAPELYAFTGGEAPTPAALRAQYERQSVGHSPTNDAGWLNWIIRVRATRSVAGYVQATLTREEGALTAQVAWLVTPASQHAGVASEAATAMLTQLSAEQVHTVRALIHPDHEASNRVAARLGLVRTTAAVDDETIWTTTLRTL